MIVLLIMIGFIIAVWCFVLSLYIKGYKQECMTLHDMFIASQDRLDAVEAILKRHEEDRRNYGKKNNNNRNNDNRHVTTGQ